MDAACTCSTDHDGLVTLKTAFGEYRMSMDARLDKLNELREQVTSDRLIYLRTDVYESRHSLLGKRLDVLENKTSWQSVLIALGASFLPIAAMIGAWLEWLWK